MRTIKKLITSMFLCAVFSFFIALQLGAQDVPSEVIKAAKEGLPIFLGKISSQSAFTNISPFPAPMSKVPSLKVLYGFKETDVLDQAYLGEPFKYYLLTPDTVLNYAKGSDVNSLLSQTDHWYFPVMIDKEARVILIVCNKQGFWKAASLGYAVLSRELGKIRQQWPTEKGYTPLLIDSLQAQKFLFTVPQYDSNNLTIISFQAEKGGGSQDYSKLEDSAGVIKTLQPLVIQGMAPHGNP
jgi:hypothetical protein